MLLSTLGAYKSWSKLSKYKLIRKTHLASFRKRSDVELMAELNDKVGGCPYTSEFQSLLTEVDFLNNCSVWFMEAMSFA